MLPPVTERELRKIYGRTGDNVATGLDDTPNKASKLAGKTKSDLFAKTFKPRLKEEIYPAQWKKLKLGLVRKPNKSRSARWMQWGS